MTKKHITRVESEIGEVVQWQAFTFLRNFYYSLNICMASLSYLQPVRELHKTSRKGLTGTFMTFEVFGLGEFSATNSARFQHHLS